MKPRGGRLSADLTTQALKHSTKSGQLQSLMVMVPIPWASRRWALPYLTVLAPSKRWSDQHARRHKKLTDWARQAILQTKRWLPDRRVIVVADASLLL